MEASVVELVFKEHVVESVARGTFGRSTLLRTRTRVLKSRAGA
jgi:hypothetical protein